MACTAEITMPPTYETLSGQRVEYTDPDPKLAKFLKRVQALFEDRKATDSDLVALIYGAENPLLAGGLVTTETLDHPVYQVLADLIVRKRVVQDGVDVERMAKRYTLSVTEAAKLKGVTQDAIRKAARERRLPSWVKDGSYFFEPASLDAVEIGGRGPIAAARTSALEYRTGYDEGHAAFLKLATQPGGEVVPGKEGSTGKIEKWRRVAVLTGGRNGRLRYFEIEPDPNHRGEVGFFNFFVRGGFKEVRRENGAQAAREAWEAFCST